MAVAIQASANDFAETIIMPGDPLRAKFIAEHYLSQAREVNSVRNMLGYTGEYKGKRISVMAHGMGIPSISMYAYELIQDFGVKNLIRIGTCGGMDSNVKSGDLVIANGAIRMEGTSREYAPIEFPAVPDFDVTNALVAAAKKLEKPYHVGVVQCKDSFYGQHSPETKPVSYELINKWNAWLRLGCKASEMESAALFIVASALKVRAGSVFLVMANQERAKEGLENPIVHDTDAAIRTAVEAIRMMIQEENSKN